MKTHVLLLTGALIASTAFAGQSPKRGPHVPPPVNVTGSVEIIGNVPVTVTNPTTNPVRTKSPDAVWVFQKEGLLLAAGSPSLTTDTKYSFDRCRVGIQNDNPSGQVVNVKIYDPVSGFIFDSFSLNEPGQHPTYIEMPGGGIAISNDATVKVLGILCR